MERLCKLLLVIFLLAGCSKSIELPKLNAVDHEYKYGEALDELNYEYLLDLTDFSEDEIEELKKNGEIDADVFKYDQYDNIKPGKYEVKVSYYSDVVRSIIEIKSNDPSPIFDHVTELNIPVGNSNFDFTSYRPASSPIGEQLTYVYDTRYINFMVVGQYPLVITAFDRFDNKKACNVTVNVVN